MTTFYVPMIDLVYPKKNSVASLHSATIFLVKMEAIIVLYLLAFAWLREIRWKNKGKEANGQRISIFDNKKKPRQISRLLKRVFYYDSRLIISAQLVAHCLIDVRPLQFFSFEQAWASLIHCYSVVTGVGLYL